MKRMVLQSQYMEHVHSDIRGPLYEEALRMQAAGTPVLKLNTGNPGSFGFTMPQSVRQALLSRVDEATPYCDVRGMLEAREAIARYHTGNGIQGVTADDVLIGNGVSEMASMIISALIGPGDEVLLPSPCYSLWSNNVYLCGGTPVFYRCDPANAWNPDPADIAAKVTRKTKALLIINPNNPTGAVYSREILLQIAEIARKNGLMLLSDEIYDRLVMDGMPYYSIASLAPDVPCATFNGLSKSHIVCGFRCGWMTLSGPGLEHIRAAVTSLAAMRLCGNALTQLVIPAAMADRASTQAMLEPGGRLWEQRKATVETLGGMEGVRFTPNHAAFYLFPGISQEIYDFSSGQDFALRLLHEKHVLVIPGTGFDWSEDLRFRIVMLPEAETLRQAMEDIKDFLAAHRRSQTFTVSGTQATA